MKESSAWRAKLDETNKLIVARLKHVDTIWVVRHCAEYIRNLRTSGLSGSPLHSPVRQLFHLLGLMLATPSEEPGDLTPGEWADLLAQLELSFAQYLLMFLPEPSTYPNLPPSWWKVRDLTMPVYLEYFFALPLMYEEQISDRTVRWFGPFDPYLANSVGLTTSDALAIVAWLHGGLMDQLGVAMSARREVILAMQRKGNPALDEAAKALAKDLESLYTFSRAAMITDFGQARTDSFLRLLATRRGEADAYFYPTDQNPALERPLIWLDEDRLACADLGVLRLAVLGAFERSVANSATRARFLAHRADEVVEKTRQVFQSFLPSEARVWTELEPPAGASEHDLLIEVGSTYLVVEVKSTPPKEPFRDPEKAYDRLRRSFRSDKGIQSAYDQAERLRTMLLRADELTLYSRGEPVCMLPAGDRTVYCICITADSHGALASNLSLLLTKNDADPYPWAVGLPDLETALNGFKQLGKSFADFCRFLAERSALHGRVFGSDELEFVGAFLRFGSFEPIRMANSDHSYLAAEMSDIFDELHLQKHGQGPGPIAGATVSVLSPEPNLALMGDYLKALKAELGKIERNDPCPCGSGREFEACHMVVLQRI